MEFGMEYLIHYIWKHRIYPGGGMRTSDGRSVEVIDPGIRNSNSGPDFFNAKIKIGGVTWVGNVEIHERASDWFRHGHANDKAYDSVVLHVCGDTDCDVRRTNGETIPQLRLVCPPYVRENYERLKKADVFPSCYTVIGGMATVMRNAWLSRLFMERMEERCETLRCRLECGGGNWEDAFFVSLARSFGFGVNGDTFERWAASLPFRALDKHRDSIAQIESVLFGMAGMLDEEAGDEYYLALRREYLYMKHKFGLPDHLDLNWQLLRMRPDNFPHVRIAQLAYVYFSERALFSKMMDARSLGEVRNLLRIRTSEYWDTHFTFRHPSPARAKTAGRNSVNLIIINTVVPFLFVYGKYMGDEARCERAEAFLAELPPENNRFVRAWEQAGMPVTNAADSQALIQLTRNYCEKRKCFFCRFGYEFLRKNNTVEG